MKVNTLFKLLLAFVLLTFANQAEAQSWLKKLNKSIDKGLRAVDKGLNEVDKGLTVALPMGIRAECGVHGAPCFPCPRRFRNINGTYRMPSWLQCLS